MASALIALEGGELSGLIALLATDGTGFDECLNNSGRLEWERGKDDGGCIHLTGSSSYCETPFGPYDVEAIALGVWSSGCAEGAAFDGLGKGASDNLGGLG